MKKNLYLNEPQAQKWRDRQDNSDSSYFNDRSKRREVRRKVKTFGTQIKILVEPEWWDSLEDHQQLDIYNQFYSTRMTHYYNTKQSLDLGTWIKGIYKTVKPNMSNYRGNKLNNLLNGN